VDLDRCREQPIADGDDARTLAAMRRFEQPIAR